MKCTLLSFLLITFVAAPEPAASQEAPKITYLEAGASNGRIVERPDLGVHFDAANVEGTFVLYDLRRNRYIAYDLERADSAFIPASTFKIFNSLVALETRVIEDAEEVIEWDGIERSVDVWNQDHNLRSAFKYSAVWFYQVLARRIGEGRMWRYVQAAEYGNVNVDGGIDRFWLDGELRISAMEQVHFLRRLYRNDLPFSQAVMDVVKDVMIVEEGENYVIRAKTGWGQLGSGQIGWWVGYVERGDDVFFFSTNVDIRRDEDALARMAVPRAILRDLGII